MSRDEDQRNEMEAMEAIYGQDYSVVSAQPPREYNLTLTPNQDGTANHVSCRLNVKYPPTYPDVQPTLAVQTVSGLSKQQLEHVTTLANTEAANSVGTESMFQVSQAIRDWLVEHNKPTLSMHQQMQADRGEDGAGGEEGGDEEEEGDEDEPQEKKDARREKREAERRAARGPSPLNIAPGTQVTTQSFMAWKARFDEEQARKREEEEKRAEAASRESKMSGKQLWLSNLAKELEDEEADSLAEEKVDAAAGGKDKLFYFNAAVYADDDAALPEDDDEEEEEEEAEEDNAKSEADEAAKAKQAEEQRRKEEEKKQADEAKEKERRRKEEADRQVQQKQKAAPQPSKQADKGKAQQPAGGGSKGKDAKAKGKK